MSWRTGWCSVLAVVVMLTAGPGVGWVVALTCNSKAAPPKTDCPTSGSQCEKRYTKQACEAGTAQYPKSNTWGPCQTASKKEYCFDTPTDADCYDVNKCTWSIAGNGSCVQGPKQSTEPDRPVMNYDDCDPAE